MRPRGSSRGQIGRRGSRKHSLRRTRGVRRSSRACTRSRRRGPRASPESAAAPEPLVPCRRDGRLTVFPLVKHRSGTYRGAAGSSCIRGKGQIHLTVSFISFRFPIALVAKVVVTGASGFIGAHVAE